MLRTRLRHRRLPAHLAVVAVVLCTPALWLGWQADDLIHQAALRGLPEFPEIARHPLDLFSFLSGDPAQNQRCIDKGILPWWTYERTKASLFRPLTCLTHWLDYRLWPSSAVVMHIHSLAWFAGVVAAATALYRRLIPTPLVAGLAALLFAIDDAHSIPASWLANRNATTAMFFGLLTLLAHDRWRRDHWTAGAWLAPLALLLALLSGEAAVATGGYLLAYALFIDRAPPAQRWLTLLPCTLVGVGWWIAYKLLGHGVAGSEFYIDPGTDPLRFLRAAAQRAPVLLWGQWATPPSETLLVLSHNASRIAWWVVVAVLALLAVALAPLLRRDRIARFWCVGMLLSVLPVCATLPADRLLFFVSLGGMGLVASLLTALFGQAESGFASLRAWRPLRWLGVGLIVCHCIIAPVNLALSPMSLKWFGELMAHAADSLPSDAAVRSKQVFILNTPSSFLSTFNPIIAALKGRAVPARTLVLGSGIHAMHIARVDTHTLVIRPEGGYYPRQGSPLPGRDSQPVADFGYMLQIFDRLFRDDAHALRLGDRIELTGLSIEIAALTADGRPAEALFRFNLPLDDPSLIWVQWSDGRYAPIALPAEGQVVTLPPASVPF